MAPLPDYFRERLILVAIIVLSLAAGLIGSFGRDLNDGVITDKRWWFTRLLIMPFLGIVTAGAATQFNLNVFATAVVAAVLAMMGHSAVGLILNKAKKVAALEDPPEPPPFHSLVDTDQQGRTAAHIEPTDRVNPRRGSLGRSLRETYEVKEAPDDEMNGFLGDLDL